MMANTLRYRISDLHQLPQCKSNNSRDLSLRVEDLIQNSILTGIKVSVNHTDFGTLFCTVLNAQGNLVSQDFADHVYDIPEEVLLAELYKYGFIIEYREEVELGSGQIEYLKTLQKLNYDKIRFITVAHTVRSIVTNETMIVCFRIEENQEWLNNTYNPSYAEYQEALLNGSAINITKISYTEQYSWDWLYNKVMSIDDILASQEKQV